MSIIKKAECTTAFFKCGILGFQGSGKTYTAALMAAGISKAIKNLKVCFFDTETGSDFLLDKLKEDKLEVFQVKSRSFSDLLETIEECEKKKIGVLIVDSITHVWRDLCDSYAAKLGRKRLQFQDWQVLKREWGLYTDRFVNSLLHFIVCGRAGYEYEFDFNEDGSKDLIKTGTKMKVESEFGFEPSLVIEMERVSRSRQEFEAIPKGKEARQQRATFSPKIGSGWTHRAHVLKDRTDRMNGAIIDNPTFKDFKPHFDCINIGGKHMGVDTSRSSKDRFAPNGKPDWKKREERKTVVLAELREAIFTIWPSQSIEDKGLRRDFIQHSFGVRSWEAVEQKELEELEVTHELIDKFKEKYTELKDIKQSWEAINA